MNVLDSSGWLEYLLDAENADTFAPVITDVRNLIVPTIVLFEVTRVLRRVSPVEVVDDAISVMTNAEIVELDLDISILAAELAIDNRLAMGDAIIYATATMWNAEVWTQDADLRQLPRVRYFAKLAR